LSIVGQAWQFFRKNAALKERKILSPPKCSPAKIAGLSGI
jgi:hypothetical protein